MLEIRDMVCGYGGVTALRGISLEVKAGQLVALIGANGAGKSRVRDRCCSRARTSPAPSHHAWWRAGSRIVRKDDGYFRT